MEHIITEIKSKFNFLVKNKKLKEIEEKKHMDNQLPETGLTSMRLFLIIIICAFFIFAIFFW